MTDTVKEFLISLGYEEDENSKRGFLATLEEVSKRVIEFGIAIKLSADVWKSTILHTSEDIERLYWIARQTSSSIAEIQAIKYAAENLGSTGAEMESAVRSFSQAVRESQGLKAVIEGFIGPTDKMSGPEALLRYYEETFKYGHEVQTEMFKPFGVPEQVLWMMRQAGPQMRAQMREAFETIEKTRGAGTGEGTKSFMEAWRRLLFVFGQLQSRAMELVGGPFADRLKQFSDYLSENSDAIGRGLVAIAKVVLDLAWALVNLVITSPQWIPVLEQLARNVRDIAVSINSAVQGTIGWKAALVTLAGVLLAVGMVSAIRQMVALTAAFAAFLALFGIRPALGGEAAGEATGGVPGDASRQNLEGGPGIGGSTGPGLAGGRIGGGGTREEPKGIRGRVGGIFSRVRHAIRRGVGMDTSDTPGSSEGLRSLIEREAKSAGIDPRIMYGIIAGESGHTQRYDSNQIGESSWGPFQMNRAGGLGNEFEKDNPGLDVRDPKTIPAQVRWIARFIAKGGRLSHWRGYHGNRDWNPRWGSMGYVAPTETPKIPSPGPGPSQITPPRAPEHRTPLGDLGKVGDHFDLHGPTLAGVSPGYSTWHSSIKDVQGERKLSIDVHGASDPEAVAKHINRHINESRDEMVNRHRPSALAGINREVTGRQTERVGRDKYGDN